MNKKLVLMLIVCISFLLISCVSTPSEDGNVVRIGTNKAIGAITPFVAEELGLFDEVNVKVIEFSDGTAVMEAMVANEIDMCIAGAVPVANWNAKGADVKIVSGANSGGHVIMTRDDSGIRTIEDLKGKKLATPSVGTATDVLLRSHILGSRNILIDDVELIAGIAPADMANALMVGNEVDAIMTWEPFASIAEMKYDNIVVVYDCATEWNLEFQTDTAYPVNVVAVNGAYLNNNEELVGKVVDALEETIQYMNRNEGEANIIISKLLETEVEVVENARKRSLLSSELDIDSINDMLNWSKELGYMENVPEKDGLFDLRYQ